MMMLVMRGSLIPCQCKMLGGTAYECTSTIWCLTRSFLPMLQSLHNALCTSLLGRKYMFVTRQETPSGEASSPANEGGTSDFVPPRHSYWDVQYTYRNNLFH